jgi:hypothetical protein
VLCDRTAAGSNQTKTTHPFTDAPQVLACPQILLKILYIHMTASEVRSHRLPIKRFNVVSRHSNKMSQFASGSAPYHNRNPCVQAGLSCCPRLLQTGYMAIVRNPESEDLF